MNTPDPRATESNKAEESLGTDANDLIADFDPENLSTSERATLQQLLLEGLDSGRGVPIDWDEIRRHCSSDPGVRRRLGEP